MSRLDEIHHVAAQGKDGGGKDKKKEDEGKEKGQRTPGAPVIPPHEDTFGAGPSDMPSGKRGW